MSLQSSNVQSTLPQQVPSSRPGLAQINICCVVPSLENVAEDKSGNDDASVGSSKESYKSCMDELPAKILKNTDEEEYLNKLEYIKNSKPTICDHTYEVGVVVVNISSEYLHLVGPLGDGWVETCVDPFQSLVFVGGVRTKEVFSVKIGAIGNMVVKECVKCKLDTTVSEISIDFPTLLWFGEEQRPTVRGAVGVVVGWERDRMVVQLEGPPAARTARLVLFHGQSSMNTKLEVQNKVLVWAWARQQSGGWTGKFLEGAAVVKKEDDENVVVDEKMEDVVEAVPLGDQAACGVQPGQNSRQLLRLLLQRLLYLSV